MSFSDAPFSDAEVHRVAATIVATYGRNALARCEATMEKMERSKNAESLEIWARIYRAVEVQLGPCRGTS